jgi:hypothetical protein
MHSTDKTHPADDIAAQTCDLFGLLSAIGILIFVFNLTRLH